MGLSQSILVPVASVKFTLPRAESGVIPLGEIQSLLSAIDLQTNARSHRAMAAGELSPDFDSHLLKRIGLRGVIKINTRVSVARGNVCCAK